MKRADLLHDYLLALSPATDSNWQLVMGKDGTGSVTLAGVGPAPDKSILRPVISRPRSYELFP